MILALALPALNALLPLILTLALIGVIVWAIETYIPMPAPIKTLIRVIVALVVIVYLARLLGLGI